MDAKPTLIHKCLTSRFLVLFTGKRFGLMQVKTGLCHILSRFEVAPCKDTPPRAVFDTKAFILIMDGEIPLSFKRAQFRNHLHLYKMH